MVVTALAIGAAFQRWPQPQRCRPSPMTLPDAVAYALDHSPSVASQRASLTQAQHALALQRGVAYPTVNGTLQSFLAKSANYQGSFAALGVAQQNVVSQNTAQVGITNWNLTTGGFSFLALAAARAQERQAANTLANTEDQIATSVTTSFYGIVQRQALVAVDLLTLRYQNDLVDGCQSKRAGGRSGGRRRVAGQDVGCQERIVAGRRPRLAFTMPANRSPSRSARRFSRRLQRRRRCRSRPCRRVPSIRWCRSPKPIVRTSVRRAKPSWPRALRVAAGTSNSIPQVAISAALGNQFSPSSAVLEQQQIIQECITHVIPLPCPVVPRGSFGFWSLQAVSTFSLPLVDYNARHSERVNDDAQLASAESTFSSTRLQSELDVRQSYRAAQTAQAQVASGRIKRRDFGVESARIAQLQYKAGVKTIYDVLQAQQAAQQAVTTPSPPGSTTSMPS